MMQAIWRFVRVKQEPADESLHPVDAEPAASVGGVVRDASPATTVRVPGLDSGGAPAGGGSSPQLADTACAAAPAQVATPAVEQHHAESGLLAHQLDPYSGSDEQEPDLGPAAPPAALPARVAAAAAPVAPPEDGVLAGAVAAPQQQQLVVAMPPQMELMMERMTDLIDTVKDRMERFEETVGALRQANDEANDRFASQQQEMEQLKAEMAAVKAATQQQQVPQQQAAPDVAGQQAATSGSNQLATALAAVVALASGGTGNAGGAGASNPAAAVLAALAGSKNAKKQAGKKRKAPAAATPAAAGTSAGAGPKAKAKRRTARPPFHVVGTDGATAPWPAGVPDVELQNMLTEFADVAKDRPLCFNRILQSSYKHSPLAIPHRVMDSKTSFISKGALDREAEARRRKAAANAAAAAAAAAAGGGGAVGPAAAAAAAAAAAGNQGSAIKT